MTMYCRIEQDEGDKMKILYIFHSEPDITLENFMNEQGDGNEIAVFDLRTSNDYALLLDMMEKSDKVISW
jgi:hypothetical protein